jgi:hypothetical protein
MALLPLSGPIRPAHAQSQQLARPLKQRTFAMALFVVTFLVLVALASALGYVADSRDSADWKPTTHGTRAGRWH